jgi:hypothetical protein
MPDVLSNEDLNALAGEYVLGTLDHDERKGASALLEVDPTFRGIVRIWEKRLGELHLMVEAVDPEPQLWERIRPKVAAIEQVPPAIASEPESVSGREDGTAAETAVPADSETTAPEPAPAATAETESQLAELAALVPAAAEHEGPAVLSASESPPASDDKQSQAAAQIEGGFVPPPPMIRRSQPLAQPVRKSGRGWMAASLISGLVAIVLAGLIGAWRFFPERLPSKLRAYTVLNIQVPPPPAPPVPPTPPPPMPFQE